MKSSRFQVLSDAEIKTIQQHTLEILETVGIKVEVKKMRRMLADLGCRVDEAKKIVYFKPSIVESLVKKAPRGYVLCGADPNRQWPVNPDTRVFGGLGTAINFYDLEAG